MKTTFLTSTFIFLLINITNAQTKITIDTALKNEVIDKVAEIMREKYVFEDVGIKMADHIRKLHRQGKYDSFSEIKPFCSQMTKDLREISHDKHLFVFHSPEERKEVAARNNLLPAKEIQRIEEAQEKADRKGSYGFNKVEILDRNIGYIDLNWFSGSPKAEEKVIETMKFLSDTEAIIIDLRDNGGGGGTAGNLLMSYFFDKKVPFTGAYSRETGKITKSWSLDEVPGKKRPDVDLYILISKRTFSAAEDFSYTLQALDRATIVGEPSKGGAHPVDVIIVKGDILTQVSIGNSVNPLTGSNWEGTGVIPDIRIDAVNALETALNLALDKLTIK